MHAYHVHLLPAVVSIGHLKGKEDVRNTLCRVGVLEEDEQSPAKRRMLFIGTVEDPIVVKSAGAEHYVGCTGFPADSHTVIWLTVSAKHLLCLMQTATEGYLVANPFFFFLPISVDS